MSRPLVFLSHSARDAALVKTLRDWIDDTLLGRVDFFQSSDDTSLRPGSAWFDDIVSALTRCQIVLVIVTPDMLRSNWAFFEAGGGHLRDVPVVPVCGFGVSVDALPSPLNELTAVDVSDGRGQTRLLKMLSAAAEMRSPENPPALPVHPDPPLALLGETQHDAGYLGHVRHQQAVHMFFENMRELAPVLTEITLSGASLTDFVHLRTNALADAARQTTLARLSIVIKAPDPWWSEATHRGMGFRPPYDASDSNSMLEQARRDLLVLRSLGRPRTSHLELCQTRWPTTYAAGCLVAPTRTFAFFEPLMFDHPLVDRYCVLYVEGTPGSSPFISSLRASHDRLVKDAHEVTADPPPGPEA